MRSFIDQQKFSRRRFLKSCSMFMAVCVIPIQSCNRKKDKNEYSTPAYELTSKEKEILLKVQEHLFPDNGNGPGIKDINALEHYQFVLQDTHLKLRKKKILINGMSWIEETSKELFGTSFVNLNPEKREQALRDLESYKNGKKWLSYVLTYIFEALLGAPAYGINKNQLGWKWLNHSAGFPQPEKNNIYGTYGYGI